MPDQLPPDDQPTIVTHSPVVHAPTSRAPHEAPTGAGPASPHAVDEADRPSWLAVIIATVIGTLGGLFLYGILAAIIIATAVVALVPDLRDAPRPATDGSSSPAQTQQWVDEFRDWYDAEGADILVRAIPTLIGAAILPLLVVLPVLAAIYKLVVRSISRCRVRYLWALLAVTVGWAAGLGGLVLDVLVGGLSFGLISLAATSFVTAWLLRRGARPAPRSV